jgi:hypothetical protein
MESFLFKFYQQVIMFLIDSIIKDIDLVNNLNECTYNKKGINQISENINLPIVFCLGGMGYSMYEKIIKTSINTEGIKAKTKDFDFSFSLKNNDNAILDNIVNKINTIFNTLIKDFNHKIQIDNITHTITSSDFEFQAEKRIDRLHIKINCDTLKDHILEMSFWFNGKISDNFTINDFKKNKLFIYNDNNYTFYLLPLVLLVKTTFTAIFDFLERRHYDKCYKYISRIEYIKNTFKIYKKNKHYNNEILDYIFSSYQGEIRKKYKIIYDYPFILSFYAQDINKNDRNYIT